MEWQLTIDTRAVSISVICKLLWFVYHCASWMSLFSSDSWFCFILILETSRASISCYCLQLTTCMEKQLMLKTKYKYDPNNHHPLINRRALTYRGPWIIQSLYHVYDSDFSFKWHLRQATKSTFLTFPLLFFMKLPQVTQLKALYKHPVIYTNLYKCDRSSFTANMGKV